MVKDQKEKKNSGKVRGKVEKPSKISSETDKEATLNEDRAKYLIADRKKFSGHIAEDYNDIKGFAFEFLYGDNSVSASYLIFKNLAEITRLSNKILAGKVFELTEKTLNTYRKSLGKTPMRVRELSIKLNELYLLGSRVFGSTDNFNLWMDKPSYGLGGMAPMELLNTVTGIDMILDELVSIQFGTTA